MPYVTHADVGVDGGGGVATNAHDFIKNKLVPFMTSATLFPAAGDRWALSKAEVIVGANESEFFLTRPTNAADAPFMAFHTKDQRIFQFPSDSFDTTTPSYDQPGGNRGQPNDPPGGVIGPDWAASDRDNCQVVAFMGAGPFIGHHLFAPPNGAYVHAAIQCATRRWRHMLFGAMDKFAAFTGGAYSCGHYWDQGAANIDVPGSGLHQYPGQGNSNPTGDERNCGAFRATGIRAGVDWFTTVTGLSSVGQISVPRQTGGVWSNVHGTSVILGAGAFTGGYGSFGQLMWAMSPSNFSGYQPMVPMIAFASVNFEGANRWAPIGKLPDIARVAMKFFTPAQRIQVGADFWRVFPLVNNDTVNTLPNEEYSGYEGIAYRERA